MNSSNQSQKRVLIAVVLSFLFFIVYGEFFVSKPSVSEQNISSNEITNASQTNAPSVAQNDTQAPGSAVIQNNTENKVIATIQSKFFKATIDHLGRISSFELQDERYKDENGKAVNLIKSNAYPMPLELRFQDLKINDEAFKTSYTSDKSEVFVDENGSASIHLKQVMSDLTVDKIITFYPQGNYDIDIKLSKNTLYFISPGSRPSITVDAYTVHGVLTLDKDDTLDTFEDGDVKNDEIKNNIVMTSTFDRYYASLFYNFNSPFDVVISKTTQKNNEGKNEEISLVFIQAQNEFKSGAYIGSKEHSILQSIDPRLEDVVEYGWFTFIAKPMFWFLNFLHTYLGNWGWSIVVLVLIIRLILFPLTYKSMISMNKLKDLAPRMKEIREKYKGDAQKMNAHMMELYKKHGANPFAGCLPILLQIPVFFAIYRVLLNAIELKAAPWAFWIVDLSVKDPFYILPIFMGATMFLQQIITPMAIQDPTQAKIMKFLPVVFTFFFLTFPAGLTLYWCVNNLCSLVQQWVVNKLFAKEHHKNKESEHHKNKELEKQK